MTQEDCPLCRKKNRLIAIIVIVFLLVLIWVLYLTRQIPRSEMQEIAPIDAVVTASNPAVLEVNAKPAPQPNAAAPAPKTAK